MSFFSVNYTNLVIHIAQRWSKSTYFIGESGLRKSGSVSSLSVLTLGDINMFLVFYLTTFWQVIIFLLLFMRYFHLID